MAVPGNYKDNYISETTTNDWVSAPNSSDFILLITFPKTFFFYSNRKKKYNFALLRFCTVLKHIIFINKDTKNTLGLFGNRQFVVFCK